MTWEKLLPMLWEGTLDTLYMTFWSSLIAYVIGLPLGVLLVVTRKGGIRQNMVVYQITNIVINVFRSIPFIILLIFLIPLTRAVVGCCFLDSPLRSGLAFLPISLYNGKRGFIGKGWLKYLFYLAYPAHMLILFWIRKTTIGY